MKRPFGVYIHFPYCLKKCGYCGFYSKPSDPDRLSDREAMERWREAILSEWRRWSQTGRTSGASLVSIFFGGGTPSLLNGKQIESILDAIANDHEISGAEITLEANPESLNHEKLSEFKAAGVNRLSMGVQSFQNATLGKLERIHDAEKALDAFRAARKAGWENLSMDLIFGHAGQTLEMWRDDLRRAIDLQPEHLSAYSLTLEPNSPWSSRPNAESNIADADRQADLMELTAELLESNGYDGYEISNFAQPQRESRHNLLYWRREDYVGLGPSAHGLDLSEGYGRRWAHPSDQKAYLAAANGEAPPWKMSEVSQRDAWEEVWLGRLRLAEGVPDEALEPFPEAWRKEANRRAQRLVQPSPGWMERDSDRWRLTRAGRLLADEALAELMK